MSSVQPTILRIIAPTIGNPYGLPAYGGVLIPPVKDSLLVWLKGDDDEDVQKPDSHKKPYAENFDMRQSHCIALNGTDEWGDFDLETWDDGFIFETGITADSLAIARGFIGNKTNAAYYFRSGTDGTIRLSGSGGAVTTTITITAGLETHISFVRPDGGSTITVTITDETGVQTEDVTLAGTFLFNVLGRRSADFWLGKFWDTNLNGVHFRIAEGPGDGTNLTSFSDDYENDGLYITWTGIPATMWAQRQDSYHGNAVDGKGHRENIIDFSEDITQSWAVLAGKGSIVNETTVDITLEFGEMRCSLPKLKPLTSYILRVSARSHSGSGAFRPDLSDSYNNVVELTDTLTEYIFYITSGSTALGSGFTDFRFFDVGQYDVTEIQISEIASTYVKTQDFTLSGDEYLPFLNDDKGGTFNDCETSYGPEEFPIGTGNGVDDLIQTTIVEDDAFDISCTIIPSGIGTQTGVVLSTLILNDNIGWRVRLLDTGLLYFEVRDSLGANLAYSTTVLSNGASYKVRFVYDGITTSSCFVNDVLEGIINGTLVGSQKPIMIFARLNNGGTDFTDPFQGVIRDVSINGRLIRIDEGEGTDIHDSDGNVAGLLSGDPAFWAGEPLVSQAIGDAEAASTSGNYLTDGKYHALYMTQQAWGEFGSELIVNGEFIYGSDSWTLGTGWSIVDGEAVQDGTGIGDVASWLKQSSAFEAGKTYNVSFELVSVSGGSGELGVNDGFVGIVSNLSTIGVTEIQFTAVGTGINFVFETGVLGVIDNISVREVNQVMNKNKQYYFCAEAGLFINKNVLTDAQHLEYIEFLYNNCYQEFEALIDEQSGSILYDEVSGSIIYDEEA